MVQPSDRCSGNSTTRRRSSTKPPTPSAPGAALTLVTVTGLWINSSSHPGLPTGAREQARADSSPAGQARSQRDELAMVPTMMAHAGAVTDLAELPLCVLTAPVDAQTGWLTPQMDLAALSSHGIHLVVVGASHESLLDNQSDAAVAGQAIVQVTDAARTWHSIDCIPTTSDLALPGTAVPRRTWTKDIGMGRRGRSSVDGDGVGVDALRPTPPCPRSPVTSGSGGTPAGPRSRPRPRHGSPTPTGSRV